MNLDKIRIYLATARKDMDELYEEIWVPTHAEGVLDVGDILLANLEEIEKEMLLAFNEVNYDKSAHAYDTIYLKLIGDKGED